MQNSNFELIQFGYRTGLTITVIFDPKKLYCKFLFYIENIFEVFRKTICFGELKGFRLPFEDKNELEIVSPGRGRIEGIWLPGISKAGQVNVALSQRFYTIVNGD